MRQSQQETYSGTGTREQAGRRGDPGPAFGKEEAIEAREADYGRAVGGDEAITTRLGAAASPIGIVLTAISLQPSQPREKGRQA